MPQFFRARMGRPRSTHPTLVAIAVAVGLMVSLAAARPAEAATISARGPHVIARSGPYVAEATDYVERATSGPYEGMLRGYTLVTYRTATAPSYGDTTIYNRLYMNTPQGTFWLRDSGFNNNFFDNKHSARAYSFWGCPPTSHDPNIYQSDGFLIDGKFPNGVRFAKSHKGTPIERNCPEPG